MEKNENFKSELETQYSILIKASEKTKRKRYICVIAILVLTFLSVLVSIFFSFQAYKNSKNIDTDMNEKENIYYQTLSVMYNGSEQLNLTNIGNGYTLATPRMIQITNEGDSEIIFNLKITSIKTSLLSTNNLVYTLIRDNNSEESISKELPLNDKEIANNVKIAPKETISYTIKVSYNGTMESDNYTNYYNAKVAVEMNSNKSNLLE